MIVPSRDYYPELQHLLDEKKAFTELEDRKRFATYAFDVSSHYDAAIYNYFSGKEGIAKALYYHLTTLKTCLNLVIQHTRLNGTEVVCRTGKFLV